VLVALGSLGHWLFWISPPVNEGVLAAEWPRRAANLIFLASAPFALLASIGLDIWGARPLLTAVLLHAFTWSTLLTALAVGLRVRRRILATPVRSAPPEQSRGISRRRLLVDASLGTATVATVGPIVHGVLDTSFDLRVERYTVRLPNLPQAFAGLRIVQLSDTHLGPRIPAAFVRRAVATALDLAPDLILLTGDYVHNGERQIAPAAELFEPLVRSGRPVVGVLGNHDWYANGPFMSRVLADLGVAMIDNARTFLDPDTRRLRPDPVGLCLAGLGDLKTDRIDPARALAGVPEELTRIVLAHNPDTAELRHVVAGPRIDLMISGHYHGGQIKLPLIGHPILRSPHGEKYLQGLVRGPACQVLISRGVGMSILPVRIGVRPEVVEITLAPDA
jgi:predicted MPP superfamily phosphohydrolase